MQQEARESCITSSRTRETPKMVASGMLRRVVLVRTDVSEELSAYFIRVTRIDELGTTLAVTSNRHTLRRNTAVKTSNFTWKWYWKSVDVVG
jgi:hypothetical protein